MGENTFDGWANYASWHFSVIWHNDYDLHHALIDYSRQLLRSVPGMTDQTLGRNIKDRVYSWANGGGYGYDNAPRFVDVLRHLQPDTPYAEVNEDEVGADMRETLALQGYDPTTGLVP